MTLEQLEKKYMQIPQEIKDTRRWVCYRTEIKENGEETKIPTNAISGGYASTSDPLTWTSFRLAMLGCVKYNFAGLGFMLGEDPKTGTCYFGVDLDNHIDKVTGEKPYKTAKEFEDFAFIFINALNSYTEYSHSGEGVHIICKGKLPGKRNKRKGVEMYDYRRFFTMTGKVIHNVPIAERSEEVKPLWEKYLNTDDSGNEVGGMTRVNNGFSTMQMQGFKTETGGIEFKKVDVKDVVRADSIPDYELIEKIRNSQQGQEFMKLYNGDMSSYNDDHSAADMAFCKILAFWTRCDYAQMDRIFRQSGLMRDKWERRWGNGTYGSHTLEEAIRTQGEVYTLPSQKNNQTQEIKIEIDKGVPVLPQGEIVEFDERNDPIVNIKQIFKTYSYTDTGNAERFYDYFGEFFRYNTTTKGFMFWNGKTWLSDSKIYIKKYADKMIDVLKLEIKDTEQKIEDLLKKDEESDNKSISEEIVSKTKKSQSNWDLKQYEELLKAQRDNLKRVSNKAGKEAMISEIQHLHEITVITEEFDKDPNLLNTDSGVVNLATSDILPFDRKYKLSKNTNCMVSYEEPQTWIKFLHDIFKRPNANETEEIIATVQMLLGEAATGRTNKDHLVILYGNGSNGKSTFIKTVDRVFGDYAKTINSELLLQSKSSNAQSTEFSFAALVGARFLSMSETNESEKMNDKVIKQMTSGEKIAAQFKFGASFSYEPTFSPFMSTNNLPIIRSKDYGIWRRIYLIPFLNTFTDETKDIHMPEKLAAEMPQILGWIIKGCLKLNKDYKGVVPKPKCLEEALSDYKNDMDAVNIYIASNCQNFPGYKTDASVLFQNYKKWALDNNEYLMSESKFKADMQKHGFKSRKEADGWVYIGIKLNSDKKGHDFALDFANREETKYD